MLFYCFQDVSQCHTLIYFADFCRSTSKKRGLSLFPASSLSSCTVFFLVEVTRLWGLKNTTTLFVLIFIRKDMKQMGIVEAFHFLSWSGNGGLVVPTVGWFAVGIWRGKFFETNLLLQKSQQLFLTPLKSIRRCFWPGLRITLLRVSLEVSDQSGSSLLQTCSNHDAVWLRRDKGKGLTQWALQFLLGRGHAEVMKLLETNGSETSLPAFPWSPGFSF